MKCRLQWAMLAGGSALIAGAVARHALRASWKFAADEDPPEDPTAPGTPWGRALLWSAATTMTATAARLLARKGVEAGWRAAVGAPPPRS